MKLRTLTLTILLSLACYAPDCDPKPGPSSVNSSKTTAPANANRSGTQPAAPAATGAVNPTFSVTEDQLRAAFNDYVSRGEKKQNVSVGEEQSASVNAQGAKLRVLFLPPLEQAKAKGYTFGLVAKQRTPDDRKAFENVSVSRILQRTQQVDFRVFLEDDGGADPVVSFELLDKDGQRIKPTTKPGSFSAGADIITAVALAEQGQELSFPLFNGTRPYLTDEADKMRLVVSVDGTQQTLEFRLKK